MQLHNSVLGCVRLIKRHWTLGSSKWDSGYCRVHKPSWMMRTRLTDQPLSGNSSSQYVVVSGNGHRGPGHQCTGYLADAPCRHSETCIEYTRTQCITLPPSVIPEFCRDGFIEIPISDPILTTHGSDDERGVPEVKRAINSMQNRE